MLWNVVFEFFIKYIFGGVIFYEGYNYTAYPGVLGRLYNPTTGQYVKVDTGFNMVNVFGLDFPLGNYLSLIATIITMVVILLLCCGLIKKIYNMCAHIIG